MGARSAHLLSPDTTAPPPERAPLADAARALRGLPLDAITAGLQGAALAMEASGSWQAASTRFVDDATAWRPPAAPLYEPVDIATLTSVVSGTIAWHSFSFPLVSAATYLG
eukprot:2071912-Heterocapsa_arctica.AAC.1